MEIFFVVYYMTTQFDTESNARGGNTNLSQNRIRSRAWVFTWNNPEMSATQLQKTFDEYGGMHEYIFQRERGTEGTEHFQGSIRFHNALASWPEIHPSIHWERCRNWRQSVNYCKKVGTRIDGPWTNINGLTFRKTIRDPLEGKKLYRWQEYVLALIKTEPDDRHVYWFYDQKGCTGKTTLAKHIIMHNKAILLGGARRDAFYALSNRLEEDDVDIVIFNLSRADENHVSYRAIESIKDGILFSSKYESKQIVMNSPHILIFCNFPPQVEQLSIDRWYIADVSNFI